MRIAFCLITLFVSAGALAQSALDQLKAIGGPLPENLPTPRMECETCGRSPSASVKPPPASRSHRSSAPSRRARPAQLPMGATLGAAIFGSILQQTFAGAFDDDEPDAEEQARAEAARRAAEEEARARAAREEARHRALLASLKALSSPTDKATAPRVGQPGGLGLKALAALDAPQDAEQLRETASLGWDSTQLRLAVRFRPLAASAPLPVHPPRQLCQAGHCQWDAPGEPVAVGIAAPRLRQHDARQFIDLVAAGQKPQSNPADLAMARLMETPPEPEARLLARIKPLWDKTRRSIFELVWSVGAMFIDEYVPFGKEMLLMKDVYELADQSLADASAAAAWLGSTETDHPPEVVPVEEAAKPFLFRGITEQKRIPEDIREVFTLVTESTALADKLLKTWEVK